MRTAPACSAGVACVSPRGVPPPPTTTVRSGQEVARPRRGGGLACRRFARPPALRLLLPEKQNVPLDDDDDFRPRSHLLLRSFVGERRTAGPPAGGGRRSSATAPAMLLGIRGASQRAMPPVAAPGRLSCRCPPSTTNFCLNGNRSASFFCSTAAGFSILVPACSPNLP